MQYQILCSLQLQISKIDDLLDAFSLSDLDAESVGEGDLQTTFATSPSLVSQKHKHFLDSESDENGLVPH